MLGHCFASFLSLAPPDAVPFVGRFLKSADGDIQLEAASALAQCRDPRAVEALSEFWQDPLLSLETRRALLLSLAASPVPAAAELLLDVITGEHPDLTATAITALATSRFRAEMRSRVAAAVEQSRRPELSALFAEAFGDDYRA